MRFGTVDGRFVLLDGHRALDVADASGGSLPSDAVAALEQWDAVGSWAAHADWSGAQTVTPERLGPPVPAPRQVFAIALNYAPHAAEAGFEPPAEPLVFTKFPSCITGPGTSVALPPGNVDWEGEGVAGIGGGGHPIPPRGARGAGARVTPGP